MARADIQKRLPAKLARSLSKLGRLRGPQWLGDVVIVDDPITAEPMTFDAITANGDRIGPFDTRVEAAVAIGTQAVQR